MAKLVVAGLVAIAAMSLQGLSPATAADPESTGEPTTSETPTPTPAPTEEPAEPEATGLLNLTFGNKTSPIKIPGLTLPLNLGWLDLNPQPAPTSADPQFGGGASGLYAEALVADVVKVKTGQLGAVGMVPDGGSMEHTATNIDVADIEVPPPAPPIRIVGFHARGVKVATSSSFTFPDNRPRAFARTDVAELSAEAYFANITVDRLTTNARVERLANGEYQITGGATFGSLSIAGIVNHDTKDIAPNTTYAVPGLGKVVLNEQTITDIPGDRHAAEVHAVHITVNSSSLGVPVGTDIYIGSAEAIIYE